MDFVYDAEQEALKAAMAAVLGKAYDSSETRRAVTQVDPGWSEGTWQQLAETGALGLPFAEADGGFGAGPVEVAIVAEEIGRVIAPEPYVETVVLAGSLVQALGSDEQRAHILGGIAEGTLVPAVAHAETGARYGLQPTAVTAAGSGDSWTLSGTKEPVITGERADLLIVTAALPSGGTGVFVVEPDATGLTRMGYRTADGGRAAKVTFADTPATPLGSAGSDASDAVALAVAKAQVAYCHEALGAMETALHTTVEYLKTRKQFGVPLMTFQALTFRAADMYMQLELARSIVMWATLVLADSEDARFQIEAAQRAKLKISTASRLVSQEAVQMHGGIGVTAEYSIAHYMARLTVIDHLLGDGAHQLGALAASVDDHAELDPFGE
ncbi:MAG TPA: acyl-CoA dehydrogenase family protein [Aeromicrobium sp.]|nr:acyl-CoA dehydrogenase family protein [Aeromicrobium sp.]